MVFPASVSRKISNATSDLIDLIDEQLDEFDAGNIDRTAERYYIEDGFIRELRPHTRSVLFQQPDIYVVVKKRMFSTLQDNSRQDLLEENERILIAATKRLFQNKTRALAAYEKLTKIQDLSLESGRFNTFLGAPLIGIIDQSTTYGKAMDIGPKAKSAIEKLRRILSYGEPGQYSNWTTSDFDAVFGSDIGEGPGTFELTNISNIKTNVSTEWGGGSAALTLEDPYNLLTITEEDIDQALADIINPEQGSFFKLTNTELNNRIEELKRELAIERRARGASAISFKISAGTVVSKRVRAILDDEGREIKFTYATGIETGVSQIESAENFFDVMTSIPSFFSPGSVQIEPEFLEGNDVVNISVNNQLTQSERQKFTELISDIFTKLNQESTSRRELKKRNAQINYARNRMRLFFNGKYVIQPMDTITIWMNSRTDEDQRLPGGFAKQQNESGISPFQTFDNLIQNINNSIASLRDPTGEFSRVDWDDVERQTLVGDMPKWLWRQFRQDITSQPTGPCIFSGIVGKGTTGVSGSWNDGKWTITVQCEDNTGYFDKGQVNFKPAADVFNSTIYDPLTPFDVSFDAATGTPITDVNAGEFPKLLPENQNFLLSGLATFQSGPNKGSTATEEKLKKINKEDSFNEFRYVLHNPDGMVYRWKQGIQTLTWSGRPNPQVSIDQERAVLLTASPFAGQDVMNVLSFLITGQPYNYETFLKAAIANGNSIAESDNLNNKPAAQTYIEGLLTEIQKTNLTWGNFIPFKKLVVNPGMDRFIAQQRIYLITENTRLKEKLRQRAILEDEVILQMTSAEAADASSAKSRDEEGRPAKRDDQATTGAPLDSGLVESRLRKVDVLSGEIKELQSNFDQTIKSSISSNEDIGLALVGEDVISNPTFSNIDDPKSNTAQKQRDELQLRQRLFRLTSRRFWQVRANQDQNLFIVDDQYDKNFDIQGFERALSNNIEQFNSEYGNISDKVNTVKDILGLECFANTQGHIEVRPPLYNKVPSSVFYKMFRDRDDTGVKVFPDFLESLYFNQIKGIFSQIEIIEDEIRLRAMALGAKNDVDTVNLITGNSGDHFSFLTRSSGDGKVWLPALWALLPQSTPDFAEGWDDEALRAERSNQVLGLQNLERFISKNTKISRLFPSSVQAEAASIKPDARPSINTIGLEEIRERLRIKTGRQPKQLTELFGNPRFNALTNSTRPLISRVDRLNVINQIGSFLSERQTLLRSAVNAINNLREGVTINAPDTESSLKASTLTTPFLNRKTEIPQLLEHMIEYEDEDDIGPGSGRRFVITADRIISLTISENPPPFTMTTVRGLFGEGLAQPPGDLQTSAGGNALTTAYAVDYDMWYQYGLRISREIEAPFFKDPQSQCAPFAVATLLTARENILQGSVQVAGYNEYYQPGDVVYIEDRNLLFYVRSVSHTFSYGKLDTTLELSYGHSPGEYIPTMLDTVGRILYNAQGFTGQFRNERFKTTGAARSIGALSYDGIVRPSDEQFLFGSRRLGDTDDPMLELLKGRHGERNRQILSNALYSISGSLNQVSLRRRRAKIKIVYYITDTSFDTEMLNFSEAIKEWLVWPQKSAAVSELLEGSGPSLISIADSKNTTNQKTFGINEDDIIIEEVNIQDSEKQTRRRIFPSETEPVKNKQGPSSAAVLMARTLAPKNASPLQLKQTMANSVIDIFVDYERVSSTTSSISAQNNEAAQAEKEEVDQAIADLLQSDREAMPDDEGS